MPMEEHIGTVTHYYPKAHAAAIHIDQGDLRLGDVIHIRSPEGELEERVLSLEIDHQPIEEAHAGDDVGVWLERPVPDGAEVMLVHDPYEASEAEMLGSFLDAMESEMP